MTPYNRVHFWGVNYMYLSKSVCSVYQLLLRLPLCSPPISFHGSPHFLRGLLETAEQLKIFIGLRQSHYEIQDNFCVCHTHTSNTSNALIPASMCVCLCPRLLQRDGETFVFMCVTRWRSECSANYWFWRRLSPRWWGGLSCEVPIMWNQLPLPDSACSIFIASSSLKRFRLHLLRMQPLHSNPL